MAAQHEPLHDKHSKDWGLARTVARGRTCLPPVPSKVHVCRLLSVHCLGSPGKHGGGAQVEAHQGGAPTGGGAQDGRRPAGAGQAAAGGRLQKGVAMIPALQQLPWIVSGWCCSSCAWSTEQRARLSHLQLVFPSSTC